MRDAFEEAISIGQQNEELLALGKAWCTHIRVDRGPFGVGLVEEMTRLPISGGRFTCDFARRPVSYFAMQLAESAIEFFENNCIGCGERSSGGRVPNLRTWAEPRITERDERKEEEQEARRVAGEEREERIKHRQFVVGSFSAAAQEIIGLVNRLDLDPSDDEASASLSDLVELAPEAFEEVKDLLYVDTGQLRLPVLLEVLVGLDAGSGSADLHSMCVAAVRDGWARSVGCKYLSKHGVVDDLTGDFVKGLVFQSAPSGFFPMPQSRGEPSGLLHYHSLRPDVIESTIADLLRQGIPFYRAAAAAATRHVVSADTDAGPRLLSALLDAMKFPEDSWSSEDPVHSVAKTVALVLVNSPDDVESAIDARWQNASPEYRVRLLRCFDISMRHGPEQLPSEVVGVIRERVLGVLSEPRTVTVDSLTGDYQQDASDLLRRLMSVSTSTESIDTLLFLLLSWLEEARVVAESEPEGPLGPLEKIAELSRIDYIVRAIIDAVVAASHHDPGVLLTICEQTYGQPDISPTVKEKLVRIAGRVAAKSLGHTGDVLSLVYTATFADEQVIRAAGLGAAKSIMRELPSESIPPLLAQAAVAGLTDQYFIVVASAVEAMREVPADLINLKNVVRTLYYIARAYAPARKYDQLTQNAIDVALRLAQDDAQLLPGAQRAILSVIDSMPAYNARKTLTRKPSLLELEGWSDVAIKALRIDEDQQYEHMGADDKVEILRELGRCHLTEDQIESLEQTETSASRFDQHRLFIAADVLAEQFRPDVSSHLVRTFLERMPDTIEMREQRLSVRCEWLRFEAESAIMLLDHERLARVRKELDERNTEDDNVNTSSFAALRARLSLVSALSMIENGSRDVEPLIRKLATYRKISDQIDNDVIAVFSELVESLVHATSWADATWNAEPDTDRHVVAARIRASNVAGKLDERWPHELADSSRLLANLTDVNATRVVAAKLRRIPLPPRVTETFRESPQISPSPFQAEQQSDRHSAALLIRIDGDPVMRPTVVRPGAMHQFRVEARVNEWPVGADRLEVAFLTVQPRDFLFASSLTFTPDALEQPLEIRVAGERPSNASPLSLTARATFGCGSKRVDARLAGNTTLELVTFDPGTATPLNMTHTARRLQHMMRELQNRLPNLDPKDCSDVRLLLEGVVRYGHTALDERLPEEPEINERWFQRELRFFLAADPTIGARLSKGAGRAGGTTDLILGNIVLEAKVEKRKAVSVERAQARFLGQPAQYASAGDSPVSLLVVLDTSPKRAPAGIMGNHIGWAYPETVGTQTPPVPSLVGIAIIRTGFPRPSDFSR